MGRKVVYCPHVGGFELSPKAIKRFFELEHPEITLYFYKESGEWYHKIDLDDIEKSNCFITIFSIDLGESVKLRIERLLYFLYLFIDIIDCRIYNHTIKLSGVTDTIGES